MSLIAYGFVETLTRPQPFQPHATPRNGMFDEGRRVPCLLLARDQIVRGLPQHLVNHPSWIAAHSEPHETRFVVEHRRRPATAATAVGGTNGTCQQREYKMPQLRR